MKERDLSDLTSESSEIVDEHVDKYLNVNKQISGTNFVQVSPGHNCLSITYESGRNLHQVNIPHIRTKISDTKYGIVASV